MKVLKKLVEDGKVAIVITSEYGAGWYTWNIDTPEILFDPGIVKLVESEKFDELNTYVELKYPKIFKGGMRGLRVQWIEVGKQFRISEYDGLEKIELNDDIDWMTA